MLIYANYLENDVADLNFFSPKEAQQLFRQLQKLSARNIAALKWESRKTKCWVPWYPPLMQLSVNTLSKNRETLCVHKSQKQRNEIKGNIAVEPTCIDRIE